MHLPLPAGVKPSYIERMDTVREVLNSIVEQKLVDAQIGATINRARLDAIIATLLFIKLDMRLYAVSTPTQLKDLWDTFRVTEEKIDFILETTTEFMLRIGISDFTELGECIINAYGHYNRNGVMDEDTFYRLPILVTLKKMIEDNPWFITLYMLNMLDIPENSIFTRVTKHG